MSYAQWEVVDDGDRVVLRPNHLSGRVFRWLIAVYITFGAALTAAFYFATDGIGRWMALVPIPLTIGTSYAVVKILRAFEQAEVDQGPVLVWNRTSDQIDLPRRKLMVPRRSVVQLEYVAGWVPFKEPHSYRGRTFTRSLDIVININGKYENFPLLYDGAYRKLVENLTSALPIPLERI